MRNHPDVKPVVDVTGVILAGGCSTRMGRDKATLEFGGRTLFERTCAMLKGFFPTLLIAGDRPDLASAAIHCVPDRAPGSALGGIASALAASATPWIFVVPCDLAFPDAELVRCLLAHRGGWDAVVPRTPAGFEPVFALYHKNCLSLMEEMLTLGNVRIYDLYTRLRVRYVDPPELPGNWQRALLNLNSPEDLRWLTKED